MNSLHAVPTRDVGRRGRGLAQALKGALGLSLVSLTGCSLFGGLHVTALGTAAQRPGNVAAYVTVMNGDDPVTELTADDFAVYENEQRIPSSQTQQVLLDRELVAAHRTLLLLDLSAATSSEQRSALGRAVAAFLDKVRPLQAVTVYGFAGGDHLRLIGEYGRAAGEGARAPEIPALDASRNLNGAVRAGVRELDARLALGRKPIRVGTLVVFTTGPDVAGRVQRTQVEDALQAAEHIVIGIGSGADAASDLAALATAGVITASGENGLAVAFEEAAYKVRDHYEKHYLLAYCSPARAGTRRLRLEARLVDKEGDEQRGDIEAEFEARGFGSSCNPRVAPRFLRPAKPRAAPAKRRDPPAGARTAEQEPETAPLDLDEADDGSVVPPPARPGYAP